MTPRKLEPTPVFVALAVTLLVTAVVGHSWNYNPTPREYGLRPAEIDNEDVIEGCKYTRAEGEELTYSRGGGLAMRRVSRGRELCVSWMSNGHYREPGRGWVRVSLSAGAGDTQEEFDAGVLAENIDYAAFEGVRLLIPPDTPLGIATLQWHWDYCGAAREFVTCSDILIVAEDNVSGHGLGLRGTEQQRYLGHCADGMPPLPTSPYSPQNTCEKKPTLPPPEDDNGDVEPPPPPPPEDEEEEDCVCECPPFPPPYNHTHLFHLVCTAVPVN